MFCSARGQIFLSDIQINRTLTYIFLDCFVFISMNDTLLRWNSFYLMYFTAFHLMDLFNLSGSRVFSISSLYSLLTPQHSDTIYHLFNIYLCNPLKVESVVFVALCASHFWSKLRKSTGREMITYHLILLSCSIQNYQNIFFVTGLINDRVIAPPTWGSIVNELID